MGQQARFRLLSDGRRHAVFCPDTVVALALDGATFDVLTAFLDAEPSQSFEDPIQSVPDELRPTLRELVTPTLSAMPHLQAVDGPAEATEHGRPDSRLDRLVLHVSNDCNLRCQYCYAQGGSYGQDRGLMTPQIAFAAIDGMVRLYGGVRRVQFFGGEPLLNPRLMIEVCEYFKTLQQDGHISELPRFGMVTNGVLGDERVVELMRRYDLAATISIDGPQEVHDALRGEGSFVSADRFAQRCLQTKDIRVNFECTWTPVHVETGVTIVDLIDFFSDRYGKHVTHIPPVCAPPGSPLHVDPEVRRAAFVDAARYSVRNLARGELRANGMSWRAVDALRKRESIRSYCSAGSGTLAVGVDGRTYPCFMFAGDDRFCLFRFSADGQAEDLRTEETATILASCSKETHPECCSCWAAPLCSGCIGADYIETGEVSTRATCSTIRAVAETVVLEASGSAPA